MEDAIGCNETFTISIGLGDLELITNDPTCPGGTDGSASIRPKDSPYPYDPLPNIKWSTGESGSEIYGLIPGDYVVSINSPETGVLSIIPFTINESVSNK